MKKLSFYAKNGPNDNTPKPGFAGVYPIYQLSLSFKRFSEEHLPSIVVFETKVKKSDPYCIYFDPKRFVKILQAMIKASDTYPITVRLSCAGENLIIYFGCDKEYTRENLDVIRDILKEEISLEKGGSFSLRIPLEDPSKVIAHTVSIEHIISEMECYYFDFSGTRQ